MKKKKKVVVKREHEEQIYGRIKIKNIFSCFLSQFFMFVCLFQDLEITIPATAAAAAATPTVVNKLLVEWSGESTEN